LKQAFYDFGLKPVRSFIFTGKAENHYYINYKFTKRTVQNIKRHNIYVCTVFWKNWPNRC